MFSSLLDWIWMALAIAVGVASAKWIPIIIKGAINAAGKLGSDADGDG